MVTRRGFLKCLGAAPLAGIAGRARESEAAGKPETAEAEARKATLINRFSIAGFQYYDGPRHPGRLKVGDDLVLCAEPRNPYDEFAVKIHHGELTPGHVPRSDNRHISRLLRDGAEVRGRILGVYPEKGTWQAVKVGVYLAV